MSAKICTRTIDHQTKQETIVVIDCFGTKAQVQVGLLSGMDEEAEAQKLLDEMASACNAYQTKLRSKGVSDDQIRAEMKQPKDCGCGA